MPGGTALDAATCRGFGWSQTLYLITACSPRQYMMKVSTCLGGSSPCQGSLAKSRHFQIQGPNYPRCGEQCSGPSRHFSPHGATNFRELIPFISFWGVTPVFPLKLSVRVACPSITLTYIQKNHTFTYIYIHLRTCTYIYVQLHTFKYFDILLHTFTYINIHLRTFYIHT